MNEFSDEVMSELFKSAFNNLSANWSNNAGDLNQRDSPQENPFVGQNVDLNGQKLRVERVIAEGKMN